VPDGPQTGLSSVERVSRQAEPETAAGEPPAANETSFDIVFTTGLGSDQVGAEPELSRFGSAAADAFEDCFHAAQSGDTNAPGSAAVHHAPLVGAYGIAPVVRGRLRCDL